ncbi:MAG: GIY-YIG nuclease family protein [Janthinobacterium lividum]
MGKPPLMPRLSVLPLNEQAPASGLHTRLAYIYVIQMAPGVVKVGRSVDPIKRLDELQAAHFLPLALVFIQTTPLVEAGCVEAVAKGLLSGHCIRSEFFRVSEAEAIGAVRAAWLDVAPRFPMLPPDPGRRARLRWDEVAPRPASRRGRSHTPGISSSFALED